MGSSELFYIIKRQSNQASRKLKPSKKKGKRNSRCGRQNKRAQSRTSQQMPAKQWDEQGRRSMSGGLMESRNEQIESYPPNLQKHKTNKT